MEKILKQGSAPFLSVSRHILPLIVMATGAGALFLTTLLLRIYASPETFSAWSYLATYMTFFFSFALLGAEQLIIRCAEVTSEGYIRITRATGCFLTIGATAFLTSALVIFNGRLFEYTIHPMNLVILLLAVMILLILYQINRLSGAHVIGQTAMNLWRLVLLLAVGVAVLLSFPLQIEFLLTAIMAVSALVGLAISPNVLQARLVSTSRPEGAIFAAFAVSLLAMSILGIFDRLVLENALHYDGLGFEDYFYLITLVVFPFNLLASYIGYVAARQFRDELLPRRFLALTLWILASTGTAAILWSSLLVLGSKWIGLPHVSLLAWTLIMLLIGIKTSYALLSAAVAIRGIPRHIQVANIASLIGFALLAGLGILEAENTEHILALYLSAIFVRYICYGSVLIREVIR